MITPVLHMSRDLMDMVVIRRSSVTLLGFKRKGAKCVEGVPKKRKLNKQKSDPEAANFAKVTLMYERA